MGPSEEQRPPHPRETPGKGPSAAGGLPEEAESEPGPSDDQEARRLGAPSILLGLLTALWGTPHIKFAHVTTRFTDFECIRRAA